MLIVDRVSYSYQEKPVLQSISFHLEKGETVALMGPSGAGKTTLFKLIAGLLAPTQGTLFTYCQENSATVSYMMQDDLLLPWRTLLDNVLLGVELGKSSARSTQDEIAARKLLEKVGLKGYEHYLPSTLSGGMRQRAALARTLIQESPLLLLDEPFGALDIAHREQMYALIKEISGQRHQTLFLITHDCHDALMLADRLFLLHEGTLSHTWTIPQEVKKDPRQRAELHEQLRAQLLSQDFFKAIL